MITTESLLGEIVHGTPSGNYDGSSQDWFSDAVKAANYYRGRGSVQTVTFDLTGFQGTITVEATLDADPTDQAAWFNTYVYSAGSSSPITDFHPEAILGNFTWLRLHIEDFAAGTIDSVSVAY
jgi:hypothetical protein